jgi:chemotaxis protein CheX
MLNLEVRQSSGSPGPAEGCLTAAIHLSGEWNGALLLQCAPEQARRFTGRFLSMDPPESVDDLVLDVFGELANMIGGNLKCVLTQGIRISIPTVVDGGDHTFRLCQTEIHERLSFVCEDGPFRVSVAMPKY